MKLLRTLTWLLAAAWVVLLGSIVARADASEVTPTVDACYMPELVDGKPLPGLGLAHLNRCWQAATGLIGVIHEDGLPCTQIVAYMLSVGRNTRMTVVCRTGAPQFSNYVSVNGNAFEVVK